MSSDGSNKLVRMANQIAENFDYGHDRSIAVAGVLDHIVRFWTPTMKQAIVQQHKAGEIGLNKIATDAVAALAETIGQAA